MKTGGWIAFGDLYGETELDHIEPLPECPDCGGLMDACEEPPAFGGGNYYECRECGEQI